MPRAHVVKPGECIDSIAELHGFFPGTLWDHPANASLRALRHNRNVLSAGDVVHIPDLRPRVDEVATDRVHTFKRKGVPARLSLRLLDGERPRGHLDYKLIIEGRELRGRSDGEGWLEEWVPPNAKRARLVIDERESYDVEIGHMEPVDTEAGLRGRLANLGYLDPSGTDEAALGAALGRFQKDAGLPLTSEPSAALRDRLKEWNGS